MPPAVAPGEPGRFLNAHELDALRAVTGRFIPGPPEDPDPGAIQAGAAEAIDLLLAAFMVSAPPIRDTLPAGVPPDLISWCTSPTA